MLLETCGPRYNGDGDPSGAQTERRGGAGPMGGLLGGKDPTGRFVLLARRQASRQRTLPARAVPSQSTRTMTMSASEWS